MQAPRSGIGYPRRAALPAGRNGWLSDCVKNLSLIARANRMDRIFLATFAPAVSDRIDCYRQRAHLPIRPPATARRPLDRRQKRIVESPRSFSASCAQ